MLVNSILSTLFLCICNNMTLFFWTTNSSLEIQEAKDNCFAIMTAVKPTRFCSSGLQVLLLC